MSSLHKKILGHLHWAAHWRCHEPIVIFESDDWGMQRGGKVTAFEPFGQPKDWAAEVTETQASLQALFNVLGKFQDRGGRPAVFTANFITANPDFEAIEKSNFNQYADIPIGDNQELISAWRKGIQLGVFYPQYHGRSHYWVMNWLEDLQNNVPGARALFDSRQHGGLALMKNANWRYHSEYINWRTGEMHTSQMLEAWLRQGLRYFEDAFGYQPSSAVAPHYVLPSNVLPVWSEFGIRCAQGGNYHIQRHPKTGTQVFINHPLGEKSKSGVIFLNRTVRFEPRPGRPLMDIEHAWGQIQQCFQAGVPAIIDTHRINYVGPWQEQARQALEQLLTRMLTYQPHFLTSAELGEAIANNGRYVNLWQNKLTSLSVSRKNQSKVLCHIVSRLNSNKLKKLGLEDG